MWKYVGQRLKDSAEQTCSHIKNLRSTFSTCNVSTEEFGKKEGFRRCDASNDEKNYNVWRSLDSAGQKNEPKKSSFDLDSPYIEVLQKTYQKKQKQKQQEAYNGCVELNLLQWTAGILCSIYFGQMICFYSRRRQNMKRWYHIEQLLSERSLRQTLEKFNKSQYERSFVPSNDVQHWYDAEQMRGIRALMPLVPVTNDHLTQNNYEPNAFTAATATQTTNRKSDISVAVDDLISTLGSIEFRLGMQNLRANEPEVAVSHLKLATTHRHPDATFNLGVCYESGVGIERNMRSAMECYRAAASLGHKKAMYNLGIFYVHGRGGLNRNHAAAIACFEAAEKMGLSQAKKALSLLEKPAKTEDEITWKSSNLMASKLSAVHQRHESSVI